MKPVLILLAGLSLIGLTSCLEETTCGADVRLGAFNLTNAYQTYFPYGGTEELVFVDGNGNELRMESKSLKDSVQRLIVRNPCFSPSTGSQDEYYDIQTITQTFTGGGFTLKIYIQPDLINPTSPDTIVVDQLLITLRKSGTEVLTGPNFIVSDRGNDLPSVYKNQDYYERVRMIGDTTLAGREYTEVYTVDRVYDEEPQIYYSLNRGVVGMDIPFEAFWQLDRIE
ncbi:MAG: hypothetical protein SF053_09950 [Bacteroidia bacterium]|jgi:hypothetical protein|nr:hypothetical protein [Bacteroidia bacterium]